MVVVVEEEEERSTDGAHQYLAVGGRTHEYARGGQTRWTPNASVPSHLHGEGVRVASRTAEPADRAACELASISVNTVQIRTDASRGLTTSTLHRVVQ